MGDNKLRTPLLGKVLEGDPFRNDKLDMAMIMEAQRKLLENNGLNEAKWQKLADNFDLTKRPQTKRWDGMVLYRRGFGHAPGGAPPDCYQDYCPETDEWAWIVQGQAQNTANAKPDKDYDALNATISLLKAENDKLWKILEALARRMDRLEFNAEIGDDNEGLEGRAAT